MPAGALRPGGIVAVAVAVAVARAGPGRDYPQRVPPRPDGPPPPPTVQRLRLRYAKRGRLRFSSHRDFQRALERALRRCEVPMAYSAGFTPHPKISYAGAAPTGAASEAEYVEIGLVQPCDPEQVRAWLDAALPTGLDIVDAVVSPGGALADLLQASVWRIELTGVTAAELSEAVEGFLALPQAPITKRTKSGPREVDARAAVLAAEVGELATGTGSAQATPGADMVAKPVAVPDTASFSPESTGGGERCAILHLVVRHTTPSVRPDDIVTAMRSTVGLAPAAPPLVTRLAQGPLDERDCSVADPLRADHDAVVGLGRRELDSDAQSSG
ncbi:MAG: TIGR03936 family radical SAM-associated protein [Actinomycetales bacterium]